jgi:hypothetical protein
MLDTIENPTGTEIELGQQLSKRARIEAELRTNSQRSDREIARVLGDGICHKTVGSARARLGIAAPMGNSPAVSPETSSGEEISLVGATDKAVAMIASLAKPAPAVPEFDPFEPGSEDLVIPHQPAIAVYENTVGTVVIRQANEGLYEEDPVILVRPEHVEKLIAHIRKVAAEARG